MLNMQLEHQSLLQIGSFCQETFFCACLTTRLPLLVKSLLRVVNLHSQSDMHHMENPLSILEVKRIHSQEIRNLGVVFSLYRRAQLILLSVDELHVGLKGLELGLHFASSAYGVTFTVQQATSKEDEMTF